MTILSNLFKNPVRRKQYGFAAAAVGGLMMCFLMFTWLTEKPQSVKPEETLDITGITGNAYTEKNTESALTVQQEEVSHLEEKIDKLTKALESIQENQTNVSADLQALAANQDGIMKRTDNLENHVIDAPNKAAERQQIDAMTQQAGNRVSYYPPNSNAIAGDSGQMNSSGFGRIMRTSFNNKLSKNNDTYVPPGTYAKAIVLGGADANASVTGTQDQTPIIFKLMSNGTIPGGGRSHLKNCVAIASTWGDISDERARVRLKHITCKNREGANTTIDEEIEGWVWYHGKSGIKGVPLMRDDKILTWAGLSGMLAGFASAAQYAETSQSVSALGAVNTISPNQIASYGAYGGAATAMNNLSNYYIKRAEQYHPVIQVGAGNEVTVVFEKGFWIVPHENKNGQDAPVQKTTSSYSAAKLPPEIAAQMQRQEAMRQQAKQYQQSNTNANALGQTVGVTS